MSVPRLEHIDVEITKECNWNCIHCSASAPLQSEKELSLEEIRKTLDRGYKLGLKDVGFTGGEPLLLLEKFSALIEYCKTKLGTKTHVHTNGSLIVSEESIKNIIGLIDNISITFLGGIPKTHDELTRTQGSYEQAIRGLNVLLRVNANVRVYIVPMKRNYRELPMFLRKLKSMGVSKIRVLTLSPTGKAREIWREMALNKDENLWLDKELLEISTTCDMDVRAGFCSRQSFPSLAELEGHDFCKGGADRCHINSLGDVTPCTASSGHPILSAGNLRNFNFDMEYIWKCAPVFQFMRYFHARPPQPCNTCENYSKCGSGCRVLMLYLYNSLAVPDPECEKLRNA